MERPEVHNVSYGIEEGEGERENFQSCVDNYITKYRGRKDDEKRCGSDTKYIIFSGS